uniref:Uncharacterized protein n=1 Tax=Salix viminalis TaxID=40686 RepID=A0A6N2NEB7_SALVM
MANLGSELSDTQRMFVDFGLGFHVEFTWSEALNFIALREEKRARFVRGFGTAGRQIFTRACFLILTIPNCTAHHFPIFHNFSEDDWKVMSKKVKNKIRIQRG